MLDIAETLEGGGRLGLGHGKLMDNIKDEG
jgi:hypothetical protein